MLAHQNTARVSATKSCASRLAPVVRTKVPSVAVRASRAEIAVSDGRDATGLSSLRFSKPSDEEMNALVAEWTGREFNHEHAGQSVYAPNLPEDVKKGGYMITSARKKVGSGKAAYDAAIKAIRNWQHVQLGWSITTTAPLKKGSTVCSATQTVVPWSVLPAEIVYVEDAPADFKDGKGRRFAVGMCSLNGHQLAGEERFAVEMLPDGSVWYDVFLFSKPDTLLALVSLPVVKIQQVRYVNDSASAVAAAVKRS